MYVWVWVAHGWYSLLVNARHSTKLKFIFIIAYASTFSLSLLPSPKEPQERNFIRISLDFIFLSWFAHITKYLYIYYTLWVHFSYRVWRLVQSADVKLFSEIHKHMLRQSNDMHIQMVWMLHIDYGYGWSFSSEPPNINRCSCSMQSGTYTHSARHNTAQSLTVTLNMLVSF